MPTPPPWWTLTQVAPAAQFTSAFRNTQPATEVRVVWQLGEHGLVGGGDVRGIAGERGPAERALADAEERPDVRGDEAGHAAAHLGFVEVVGVVVLGGEQRLGAQVVAVV